MEGKIIHELWEGMRKVGEKYNLSMVELIDNATCVIDVLKLVNKEGNNALKIIGNIKNLEELAND